MNRHQFHLHIVFTIQENPCSNQGKMTSFLTKKPKEDQPNCFQSLSAISPITIEGLTSTQPEPQSSSSSNSECDEDEESVIEMVSNQTK